MEIIRILFYTDLLGINEDPCSDFGISRLKELILFKTRLYCSIFKVHIQLLNRHQDADGHEVQGGTAITEHLLSQFDEVWFFGFRQCNLDDQPYNELNNDEVRALQKWMTKGGVMVTGDHSNVDPRLMDNRRTDPKTYLNLGRAIGHRLPRAGQLRFWEGPPTSEVKDPDITKRDNYNTNVGNDPNALDTLELQSDTDAQELLLTLDPDPHRLFWWYINEKQEIVPVSRFPDHMHEGRLRVPEFLDGEWPAESPLPVVVARGTDKRFPKPKRIYDLVIAYDGNQAEVGRIVSDSSFHHYLNINLVGFPSDLLEHPLPGSDLDQIATYYLNLLLWLAPEDMRKRIENQLPFNLARHPQLLEVKGSTLTELGRVGFYVLDLNLGASRLNQIFGLSKFESAGANRWLRSLLYLGKSGKISLSRSAQEVILGYVINQYHEYFDREGIADPGFLTTDPLEQRSESRMIDAFGTQWSQKEFSERLEKDLCSFIEDKG
jgi:hypothetical protein